MTIDVLAVMKHAADSVILPRWRALSEDQVEEKAPGDLVTVADRESEQVIAAELGAAYPAAVILGEEAFAAEPAVMDAYQHADHAFTIDPIDGTANFVKGTRDFAVMVAELKYGEVVRSWIWQPAHEAAFVAESGAGATRNGQLIEPHTPEPEPAKWRGATARRGLQVNSHGPLAPLQDAAWCCGVDYPNVAMGKLEYLVYSRVWPWDHAPGALLLSETGGRSVRVDGSTYGPAAPVTKWLVAGAGNTATVAVEHLASELTESN